MVVNDGKESLDRSLKDEAFVISPLVRVLAQVLFSIKRSLKRYPSDILNLIIFSPEETYVVNL